MTAGEEHPRLLLWYVTGDLEDKQAREVERHIRWCPACTLEAEALSTALRTLRGDPSAKEAVEAGGRASADLSRRDRREPGAEAPRADPAGRPRAPALLLAAAAVGFVLGIGSAWLALRQPGPEPSIRDVVTLALSPPQRGHSTQRIAAGIGPYALTLVLPFDAPEGVYHVRIDREDGAPPRLEARISTRGDGTLALLLDPSPPQGRYVALVRQPGEGRAGTPYVYPFEVASTDSTPPP